MFSFIGWLCHNSKSFIFNGSASLFGKIASRFLLFHSIALALESCTCWNLCVNPSTNLVGELNKLAGAQGPVRGSNTGSNETSTKTSTPPKAHIPPFVLALATDFFTKFMKVFIETTQAWDRKQLEPRERSFKAKTSDTYFRKSHIDCYHFWQQCKDYFKTSCAIGINYTSFAATFLRGIVNLK